jgi:hypothetical protein
MVRVQRIKQHVPASICVLCNGISIIVGNWPVLAFCNCASQYIGAAASSIVLVHPL